jgi:response regulator of citrate/malate metabolism
VTIRTLIVDDDFRVAEVHRAFVERLPAFAAVGVAHTAAEAMALADELRPDLVLLDIYLPDRSGLDVLRELRVPGRPPIDVIAITAAKDVETLRAALQSGIAHYLVKPFQFNAFREKLESYAAVHARLAKTAEVDQGEVDRIVGLLRSETVSSLPKGLSEATLELVARTLRDATDDLSAVEVARATGISRVTARRYLEHLARSGLVAVSMRYGSAGRPEHRYRWAAAPATAERPS